MNPLTVAQFRADFPEFADTNKYPNAVIQFWITVTLVMIDPIRWGDLAIQGQELATAHYVSMQATDIANAAGAVPGQVNAPLSGESVGKVSASFDTSIGRLADAGFWNLTSYGVRFYYLLRMMGAGGIQVWGCPYPDDWSMFPPIWP